MVRPKMTDEEKIDFLIMHLAEFCSCRIEEHFDKDGLSSFEQFGEDCDVCNVLNFVTTPKTVEADKVKITIDGVDIVNGILKGGDAYNQCLKCKSWDCMITADNEGCRVTCGECDHVRSIDNKVI